MQSIYKTITYPAALVALCFASLSGAQPVHAQSTTYNTSAAFGAINYEDRLASSASLYGYYEQGGRTLATSGETTYSFGEGAGTSLGAASDTIRLSGSAWGSSTGFGFNDLKAGVTATLENAYLDLRDVDNAPDQNNAKAPYYWIADASSGWNMTTRFNASNVTGNSYTVKWIFGVDGAVNQHDAGYGFAYMGFNYGSSPAQSFSTTSLLPQVWATDSMPLVWGAAAQTTVNFHANWQYNMLADAEEVREEGVLIGYRAAPSLSATVDYSSSVRLQEIQVFDQNGDRFYDFYVEDGDNNRVYNASPVVVPESGTLGLVCLGAAGTLVALWWRKRTASATMSILPA